MRVIKCKIPARPGKEILLEIQRDRGGQITKLGNTIGEESRGTVNKAFVPASSLDTEIKSFRSARAGRPVPALCKSTTRCSALMYRDISISSSGYGDEVATVANNFCALPLCYLCSPPSCAWLQKGISGFSGKTGSAAVFFQKKRRDVFERIETR